MEGLDLWRLCDELTIVQAVLLILGFDPVGEHAIVEDCDLQKRPAGYEAAKTGIIAAVRRGAIKGRLTPYEYHYVINGGPPDDEPINPRASCIDVESLRAWLESRGIRGGFFRLIERGATPDYLDPNHPRYAPKLAAAIKVWQAMEDENLLRGKGTVAAMEQWLESRYRELGLVHEKDNPKNGTTAGDMNKSAISEAAKVANWQRGGGAPKTPGR